MASKYHTNVQKGIMEFGKKHGRFKEIYGSSEPVLINHPKGKFRPLVYYPDVQFVTKHGKRIIFEILDSELAKEDFIIANVTLACLSANTSRIVFIVPTERDQDKVERIATTIITNLARLIPKSKFRKDVRYAYVLKEEAESPEAVKNALDKMEFKLKEKLLF
jgi:hypothetical protein